MIAFLAARGAGAWVRGDRRDSMFDVPVRFDTDRLDVNLTRFPAGEIPSIPMVEIAP